MGAERKASQLLNQDCKDCKPKDRNNITLVLFCLLGIGSLLPWNFFITANTYFVKKLANEPSLVKTFQNYFSLASMGPNLVVMLLNVFFITRCSRFKRMLVSCVVMIAMFVMTSCLVLIDTKEWTNGFFKITIATIVVISSASGIFQGSLFGFASCFPSKYIQAVMIGQAVAGIFASLASILSMFGQENITDSAFGYFVTATFVLFLSFVAYIYLENCDFVKYHTSTNYACVSCKFKEDERTLESIDVNETSQEETTVLIANKQGKISRVLKQVFPAAFSTFLVFFVTLSVFPSLTARIKSTQTQRNEWTDKFFVSVTCFLLFNAGDVIGRTFVRFVEWPGNNFLLIGLCILRAIFIPFFAFCNVQPRDQSTPILFKHDAYPVLFMTLFATTSGYLGSVAVSKGPRLVASKDAEVAGTAMAFSIVAGLAGGAGFSFAIAPNL